jgi:hypothetical protein
VVSLLGGDNLPRPKVKRGKWEKERERTKSAAWRKKRSDTGKKRRKKSIWDF